MENLLIEFGAQGGSGNALGTIQAEWQPLLSMAPGLTLFASGGIGDEDYSQALFGLRYYFGSAKSLIERHRQDDPDNGLTNGAGLNNRPPPPKPTEPESNSGGMTQIDPPSMGCDTI